MNEQMKEQTQKYLEYANEAATKIRDIYHIFGGYGDTSSPEEGTLLGDAYACIAEMISLYFAPITGKEMHSDELDDMTVEIMHVDKDEIKSIIKKYCEISA